MASGTISLGTSKKIEGRIVWESTANNSANTSSVTATLQVRRNDGYSTLGTWTGALNVGGTSQSYSYYGSVSGWVTLKTITITKTHNNDGTGTCYISGSVKAPTGTSQEGASVSGNRTVELDTIPRASSVTATAANIGSTTTISIARNSSNFTHTLKYSFSGLTDTIESKTTSTSYKWTVPTSFYAKIPNAKNGSCTITCETYNGNTLVGSKTTTFTATAAESDCKPTLSPTVKDTNSATVALTGDANKLVKYYSTASTDSNAASRNSATLKSQKTTAGSRSVTTETGAFANVESNSFTFTATDSRGYTTTSTKSVTMVNYIKLSCSMDNRRFTTDGVISFTAKGNYFNSSFGATNNTLAVSYRYRELDGAYGDWVSVSHNASSNSFTASVSIEGLDYQKKYVIQARAVDKLATIASSEITMSCIPVFDWDADSFAFHTPIFLDNTKQIWHKDTSGNNVLMVSINASNQAFFGYGMYDAGIGSTYFDGNTVNIRSKNNINNTAGGTIGGNKAWTNSSDSRLKENIEDIPKVFCDIWLELAPKVFKWNELNNGDGVLHFGLIAQDVIAAFKKYGLNYKDYGFVSTVPVNGVDYYAITYEYYNMLTAQVLKNTVAEVAAIKDELKQIRNTLSI